MRFTVDLGFSPSLVFVVLVCVVLPAIGFVLRRKWQRSVARSEEVRRLLVLAAEESAMAESWAAAEASWYQYSAAVPVAAAVASTSGKCALCFCPTTNRCKQCKLVYYCSGKCQIVHWRQGHKDVCRPPSNTHQTNDMVSSLGKNVAKRHYHEIHDEKSQIESTEYKASSKKPPLSDISLAPKTARRKDDNEGVESLVDENITDSNSELSSNAFSGFSASNSASESSDDSSACESNISNEPERSDGHNFADSTLDNSLAMSNDNNLGVAIPLSPKFASSFDAADGFPTMHKVNLVRPGFSKEDSKLTSSGSSGLSMGKVPTIQPSTVSSGFWDKTLDSTVIKDDANSGSSPSYSGDALPKSFRNNVPCTGSTSLESERVDSLGFAGASGIHNLQSVGSKASNHVVDSPGSTLRSAEISCMPHVLADTKLVSRAAGHSHYSTKSGNNGIQSGTDTSSHVASCPPNSKNGLKSSVLKVGDQIKGSNLSKHVPLAVGSDIAGRYSDKGLFPYDSFVKLYNWNRVVLQPFGLINCGNSCFANAVLQCLAFTPPLTAYMLQGLHSKSCANMELCFTCEFESLILKSKEKSPLSPLSILSQLQNLGSQLGTGKEEDAHEFLRLAVETMQSVCLKESGLNASDSLKEETNLMGLTFGGYLRSKIQCMKCGAKSERQERMMDLNVEIEGEIATLEEALQRFTSTETLDGENKYYCVRCKSYEKAKKKLTVSEAPNILTVALKRFQAGKFGKLNKPIRFPEILDFAPFMSGTSDKSPIYRLYGVVVHLDIMNDAFSGHYVCYVKNLQNKWFKVDDSVVTAVELESVLTKGAYMLFYARCSPRAPRSIRNKILSSDSKIKVNGKTLAMKPRHVHVSADSGALKGVSSGMTPDVLPSLETFYLKFHHLKRVLEEDSSDNSSLFSNNSDECSCSTDSTRDSTSNEDFADYIFGDPGPGLGSMVRNSDSDTPSHLNSRHLPLSNRDPDDSALPDAAGLRPPPMCPRVENDGLSYRGRPVDVERRGGVVFHLHPNTNVEHRKSDTSRSSSRTLR